MIKTSRWLIFYEIKGNLCGILTNTGAAIYHSFYAIIGGGILTATIMIICALLIGENLANKQRKRKHHSIIESQRNSVDQQVLRLLFTTRQLFYLIFTAISNTIPNRSRDRLTIERFISFLAELVLYMFPVIYILFIYINISNIS